MNKAELIEAVMAQVDLGKAEATDAVSAVFDTIVIALMSGDEVSWPGFCIFNAKVRAARTGRNPLTGAEIQIAAAKVPGFKAAKGLKDALNA
ncbi:MAG: HU family DNA-binding protein [Gammaproteobacteria bacterium]|nr:HU family DNA-binding protein [Gammaproteobacteria bacterium]